jgi:hypothetical protein
LGVTVALDKVLATVRVELDKTDFTAVEKLAYPQEVKNSKKGDRDAPDVMEILAMLRDTSVTASSLH